MSVVYKYLSPDLKECYVGSTAYECERKSIHKGKNKKCSSKLLFEKYGYDNCSYVVLEVCSLEEQRIKEQWWIDHAVGAVNQKRAFRTEEQRLELMKEYYEDNKDVISKQQKEYYDANKDLLLEQGREYYYRTQHKVICECGGKYSDTTSKNHHLKTKKHQAFLAVK